MVHAQQKRTGGKASRANFIGVERSTANSAAFIALSPLARALYFDLRRQFNGKNNGDISIADTILAPYGWAHSTIAKQIKHIVEHGLMVKTRQGGIAAMSEICSLYGFTDLPIMANPAKGIKGAMASHDYLAYQPKPRIKRTRKKVIGSHSERSGTRGEPMGPKTGGLKGSKVHAVNLQ